MGGVGVYLVVRDGKKSRPVIPAERNRTMKTATLSVLAFEVQCPHCNEPVEFSYTGSFMWLICDGDIPTGVKAGQEVECSGCGQVFRLPKTVTDNKLPAN